MHRNILSEMSHLKTFHQQLRIRQASFSLLNQVRFSSISYCVPSSQRKYQNLFYDNSKAKQISIDTYLKGSIRYFSKEPSIVEETVKTLKVKKAKKIKDLIDVAQPSTPAVVPAQPKRSLRKRIWDELVHYYHGFRLLFIDIKVSSRLVWKILNGRENSRREHRQLVRTVSDLFRLVPFSVFIIVPFMEFLLPVVLKLFPAMLPSTFQTHSEKEKKFKAQLKLKIETAKFLQDTLDEMALQAKEDSDSHTAKEFAAFFEKIRASDQEASNEDIIKFSKLFEDEITLDNLDRPSLTALCRLLELQPIGTDNFLRFQLRMNLRSLKADDQVIVKEGIDNLSVSELQAACQERGMKAFGMTESHLRSQLQQWLELSLNEEIPPSLLLLSRALYLPETLQTTDRLKATISTLPETVASEAKLKISEIEGKVDNKTKLELIKKEEEAIIKEAKELAKEMLDEQKEVEKKADFEPDSQIESLVKDILIDKAPNIEDKAVAVDKETKDEELSKKDLNVLEDALENIANEKKQLLIEKEEIEDLKEEMADYKHDIEELKDMVLETGHKEMKESKAAIRLSKKVSKMISKMDNLIDELGKEKEDLHHKIVNEDKVNEGVCALKEKDPIISINELLLAIKRMLNISDDTRLQQIADVLEKMDNDHDGSVEVDHVLKVLKLLGKDNVKVTTKQMDEIIELMLKEDSLELEEKIQKQQKQVQENGSKKMIE